MAEQDTFVLQQADNNNDSESRSIKIELNEEEIAVDYDSDSDDGFSVVKINKNQDPVLEQTECIHDILETILSIPSFNKSFVDHIKSHNNLISDLLKTHITSTNNIHLLSLLYFCIDLLITNKSEIGLLCFNRLTNLSLSYENDNEQQSNSNIHYSINKKSLRLLTKMVNVYGSQLLSLIYKPLNQHFHGIKLNINKTVSGHLRSGSILQIAKLYAMNDENRAKINKEWRFKHNLYDILKDRDNDKNMDINTMANTLIALTEMSEHNKSKSILKYCNIPTKIQMIIIDKLLNMLHSVVSNETEINTFGIDIILESLSSELLNNHLSLAYVFSVAQQLQLFIRYKTNINVNGAIINKLSGIKALIKCLRIIEEKEKRNIKNKSNMESESDVDCEYIECISSGLTYIVLHCQINKRCELLWSILHDINIILCKYAAIAKQWTAQQIISSFGLIFNDRNYVKQIKLVILCKIITINYVDDVQCDVIIAALNSYLLDCVDGDIINNIMDNIRDTICNMLLSLNDEKYDIINRLFGLITTNTLNLLPSQQLFIIKYSYFVTIIKKILIMFKHNNLKINNANKYKFLCVDYQRKLVQNVVSFYLKLNNKFTNNNMANSVIYLTGEYCEYLRNEQIFNVFNYILPTFESESQVIQLSIITAITKIYLKINKESKSKIKPLLSHIFTLCTNTNNNCFNLDVRCRATMYQRLLKYDINAAKKIVLTNINIPNKCISDIDPEPDININNVIDHDLCRLSGIYKKAEKDFVDERYIALQDSDSDNCCTDEEEVETESVCIDVDREYHSSDEDSVIDKECVAYKLLVDASSGRGLQIKMKIDHTLKHKILFLITNFSQYDIYQIDMKFNKNYLGVQSLKTLLNQNDIIKVNKSKEIVIPLKLIEKSQQNIAINEAFTKMQAAIRYFQQQGNGNGHGDNHKYMSRQSQVIFFNVSIPGFLFFNEFGDNTANNNYLDRVNTMKSISRKCSIDIEIKDNDNTELIIDNVLVNILQCKKVKELTQEKEKKKKIIYMALLQFKWILIGVCIHNPIIKKRGNKSKNMVIDIITKSNSNWQSEATMQSVKFAILSERHFIGTIN